MSRTPAAYELLRQLGAGAMAEVWLARQHRAEGVQRLVVIKRLHEHLVGDRDWALAFLDEARLLASLSHPFIVPLLDLEVVDDAYVIVLEHVDGVDLAHLLDAGGRLPDGAVLAIALAIAEALAYVHTRTDELGDSLRIVHRDVSPANVVVGRSGAVKLIDFGIAAADTHEHRTRTGVLKGTLGYMAPEQLVESRAVDARADVFSWGALVYELFAGVPPFARAKSLEAARAAASGARTPLGDRRPELGAELGALIDRCLSAERDARPSDGAALARGVAAVREVRPWTLRELGALVEARVGPGDASSDGATAIVPREPRSSPPDRHAPAARPTASSTRRAALIVALIVGGGAVGALAYTLGLWLSG